MIFYIIFHKVLKQLIHAADDSYNIEYLLLADENSLLIMDMVVQLEDGSIVNLEIQKIGYKFPGERCACYSADLLLRQYKRIRDKSKKRSCYKDVRDVYTIVLFEQSPEEFKHFLDTYIHRFEQESDTGLEMNLLQKYLFVPLDIFQKIQHNKNGEIKIANRLEAWLAFLCMDRPEEIIAIIEKYPDFKDLYSQIYDMCRNIEEVMAMFSKELLEMDRNTVQLMIDDMQKELDETKDELVGTKGKLDEAQGQLDETKGQLDETKGQLDEARNEVELLRRKLAELEGNR